MPPGTTFSYFFLLITNYAGAISIRGFSSVFGHIDPIQIHRAVLDDPLEMIWPVIQRRSTQFDFSPGILRDGRGQNVIVHLQLRFGGPVLRASPDGDSVIGRGAAVDRVGRPLRGLKGDKLFGLAASAITCGDFDGFILPVKLRTVCGV